MRITISSTEFYRSLGKVKQGYKSSSSLGSEKPERWCKKHPTGIWREGYKQCSVGWKKKEVCEEGKDD